MIPQRKLPQACMPDSIPIHGTCDSCFSKVKELFQRSFDSGEEIGSAMCFVLDGKCVIDLWGSPHHHDLVRAREWESSTLVVVYSTTNGMTAICANQLPRRGSLDTEVPVSKYWHAFAAARKEKIRQMLSHEAEPRATVRAPLPEDSLCDWDHMCAALAVLDFW